MSVTVVYRSAADLRKAEFWYEEGPKMQERAIKAEAENAKLQLALKKACDMLPACPDELGRLDDMFLRAAERDLRELEG